MPKEEDFSQLLELSKGISAAMNMEQLGNLLVEKISLIFKAKKVSLMLLDKEKNELFVWAASGMKEEFKQVKIECGQMFAGWVAKEGRPLLVQNIDSEFPQFSKIRLGRYQSKSFLIAPIRQDDKTIGVINITERNDSELFSDDDLKLVAFISSIVIMQIDKIKLCQQIENLSVTDSLTGLHNHRHFQEKLAEEVERMQRYHRHCSLIIFDIDDFNKYNENYSYAMGDKVLVQMANIISDNLRKVDIVARYAGEEFAVILPDTSLKHAAMVAEKLRDKIESAVFVERRDSALAMERLTVSAGVAEYNIKNNKEQFIKESELALEEAKAKGKNRVCVFK